MNHLRGRTRDALRKIGERTGVSYADARVDRVINHPLNRS
ncbi:ISXoo3 transposase orfA [Pseudomonas syringae pv. tagetis]|uniref:ISXoo3 transposase orfA n=1 Tax=Pseudomonas syringae pv. tagetis TaxID=129140 RepID=A0A3M3YTY3_9PSED|nr:ISXoo3 transposase orfA [Pseudomonas syringae pv. apii]RMO86007.1 ISXoo3 transposase orfA [Pseudomonas syringae pv. tagetis]